MNIRNIKKTQHPTTLQSIRELLTQLHHEVDLMEKRYTELNNQSRFDDLTGLLRRQAFADDSIQIFEQATRTGSPLSLLMLDIDYFKKINDTYGHPVGDQVIQEMGHRIRLFLGENVGIAGRFGGEEFVILCVCDTLEAKMLAEGIRTATIEASQKLRGWHYSVSIGHVSSHSKVQNLPSLIEAADRALYRAKESGRNRVQAA